MENLIELNKQLQDELTVAKARVEQIRLNRYNSQKKYAESHPAVVKQAKARYYQRNKERWKEYSEQWTSKNKEKVRTYRTKYAQKLRDQNLSLYRTPGTKETQRRYYLKNRDKRLAYQKAYIARKKGEVTFVLLL